jgi:hypothetical protein
MTLTTPSLTIGSPDVSTVDLPVYANTASVTFTPYEFRITFSLLTFPHDQGSVPRPASDALVLTPRAVTDVMIPAGEAGLLADLLTAELKQYVRRFGEPHRGFE